MRWRREPQIVEELLPGSILVQAAEAIGLALMGSPVLETPEEIVKVVLKAQGLPDEAAPILETFRLGYIQGITIAVDMLMQHGHRFQEEERKAGLRK